MNISWLTVKTLSRLNVAKGKHFSIQNKSINYLKKKKRENYNFTLISIIEFHLEIIKIVE